MEVLLDANFLVLPFQENVDVFSELERLLGSYEAYTLNRTYNEALQLEDGKYRDRVKRLVEENLEVIDVDSDKKADDLLLDLAGDYVICTNDSGLREELREGGLPHIYLRGRDHLEAENIHPSAF
ncbi:MAG: hypothetical protein ABEI07_02180 [Candidatus Nanohaloarchaea archaeon]